MAIEALKVDISSNEFVWVQVLTQKLDFESRRQFELDHPEKSTDIAATNRSRQ